RKRRIQRPASFSMPCRHYIVLCPKDIKLLTSRATTSILCPMDRMKSGHPKAAIYVRVSTADQHVESQLYDLREFAAQRNFSVVKEYEDRGVSGSKARRPGLDALMADARRKRFDVVLVAAFDRVARNVRHFLEVLDELNHLGIEFVSLRENIDTGGPLGRAMVVIVGAIAQVEKQAIVERVKAGMRRARIEGRQIGRAPLRVDRDSILRDRERGLSLSQIAQAHRISKASVCRI